MSVRVLHDPVQESEPRRTALALRHRGLNRAGIDGGSGPPIRQRARVGPKRFGLCILGWTRSRIQDRTSEPPSCSVKLVRSQLVLPPPHAPPTSHPRRRRGAERTCASGGSGRRRRKVRAPPCLRRSPGSGNPVGFQKSDRTASSLLADVSDAGPESPTAAPRNR